MKNLDNNTRLFNAMTMIVNKYGGKVISGMLSLLNKYDAPYSRDGVVSEMVEAGIISNITTNTYFIPKTLDKQKIDNVCNNIRAKQSAYRATFRDNSISPKDDIISSPKDDIISSNSDIELAKERAKVWNEVREQLGDNFTKSNMTKLARSKGAVYYTRAPQIMDEYGIIKRTSSIRTNEGYTVELFAFEKPIHYSFFLDVAKFRSKADIRRMEHIKQRRKRKRMPNTQLNDNIIVEYAKNKTMTDTELVEELRSRGYEVTAIKTTTIEL